MVKADCEMFLIDAENYGRWFKCSVDFPDDNDLEHGTITFSDDNMIRWELKGVKIEASDICMIRGYIESDISSNALNIIHCAEDMYGYIKKFKGLYDTTKPEFPVYVCLTKEGQTIENFVSPYWRYDDRHK